MRSTLAQLSERVDRDEHKAVLRDVDVVLNELLLRSEHRFYTEHYRDGFALSRRGCELAARFVGAGMQALQRDLDLLPVAVDDALSTAAIGAAHEALRQALAEIIRLLSNSAARHDTEARSYMDGVVDWEVRFHARHWDRPEASAPRTAASSEASRYTMENIERYLKLRFPERNGLVVRAVQVLPGGFSKKTVLVDVADDLDGERSLVIRAEQPPRFDFWEGDQVKNEFVVLQLMHEAGLPVAEPLWLESDASWLGQNFLVSRKARGANAGTSIGASGKVSETMLRSLVSTLVKIHTTRIDHQDERLRATHLRSWSQLPTMAQSTAAWVEHWFDCVARKQLAPSPLTVRLMEWLRHNVPPTQDAPVLLHGDYGLHNTLFENERVSCVVDWEYASFGDPAEDIAMLCISLGAGVDPDHVAALYRECGGPPISEYRLRYFDVLYCMKFIVPCENALKLFSDHPQANIGLCRFGFLYTHPGVKGLNENIRRAEEAKKLA